MRAPAPRKCDYTKKFHDDWVRLSRSGQYDMHALKRAILLLVANDAPLGPEWRDHELRGNWSGYRECHIGGDFLLIYRVDDTVSKSGSVVFIRAGTHADLFG